MQEKIINILIRAGRTFFQTFIGVYLAGLVVAPTLADLADVKLLAAAAAAAIVAVVSVVQNVLEELGNVTYRRG